MIQTTVVNNKLRFVLVNQLSIDPEECVSSYEVVNDFVFRGYNTSELGDADFYDVTYTEAMHVIKHCNRLE